ncbi:MAG: citrate synthase [Sulfolobaceae archaeon]
MSSIVSKGLENVVIKTTSITYIDGEKGILLYRGYDVPELAENSSYEEVIYLILYGELPNKHQVKEVIDKINKNYNVPEQVINAIYSLPRDADPIAAMEVAFSVLAAIDKGFKWKINDKEKAIEIIAKTSTIVANIYRMKEGLKPKIPEPSESYAKSFYNACFNRNPNELELKALNAALILYADHEVPASTTAALVVSSTLSDMYSSIVAALAALKGPLHGGAAEEAFKQFLEIGDVENVERWFQKKIIEEKNRLMGFGHRVYRTYDPRSLVFKRYAESFAKINPNVEKILKIALKLEELGLKQFSSKKIYPNTDFYSGIVYYALGYPVYMYTALFALSRVLGWLAHIIEYVNEEHRLIRPRALYVGPTEKKKFIPLDKR